MHVVALSWGNPPGSPKPPPPVRELRSRTIGFADGRYWARTSDPQLVEVAS